MNGGLTTGGWSGKAFAEKHIAELDRMIAAEWRRVEAEREMRNRSNDENEPGGYRAKPF